jgi:hypothetical protein
VAHRDIKWFYEAPNNTASVFALPPYLELYYQLFPDAFPAKTDIESRYIYLCWLLNEQQDSCELDLAKNDHYILSLLDIPHDNIELFSGGIMLSKFHYYFFQKMKSTFIEWGFSIDTLKGCQEFLIWCYTWGIEKENYAYLTSTKNKFLENSTTNHLDFFDVTKIMEMIMATDESPESTDKITDPMRLKIKISKIIFNYSQYRYPLTENQISQMLQVYKGDLVFAEFWNVLKLFPTHCKHISVEDMDIHPELKRQLQPIEKNENSKLCENKDAYVMRLLDFAHDAIELFRGGVVLSKYHYYFYAFYEKSFNDWGMTLDSLKGRQKFFVWCYTWGIQNNHYEYLTRSMHQYLKKSDLYSLSFFDVTKILEMIMAMDESPELTDNITDPMRLKIKISKIIFNYSTISYPLTENQISQMLQVYKGDFVFAEFWRAYKKAYAVHNKKIDVEKMDIHPALKKRLLTETKNGCLIARSL